MNFFGTTIEPAKSHPDRWIWEYLKALEERIQKNNSDIDRIGKGLEQVNRLLLAVAKAQAGLIDVDELKEVISKNSKVHF